MVIVLSISAVCKWARECGERKHNEIMVERQRRKAERVKVAA